MVRGVSYADAVRLLGGHDTATAKALDALVGALLAGVATAGGGIFVSVFNPRSDLVKLSGKLVADLGRRLRGETRVRRSERVVAAHTIIALTAYFEVLSAIELPAETRGFRLTKSEQLAIAAPDADEAAPPQRFAALLLRLEVPIPSPERPSEDNMQSLYDWYSGLSAHVAEFGPELPRWDQLTEPQRTQFHDEVSNIVPGRAITRYKELFAQLATDFPEIALWANMVDHQATRVKIAELRTGLAGIERILTDFTAGRAPDARRQALAVAYQGALSRPILPASEVPDGLCLPPLGEAYVNPDFRAAECVGADHLAEESWWQEQPVRDDLSGFLAGYLTAPLALEAPLLVLGQPGSGKSMLTQVLAARLPSNEFLVVRVPLREVPADVDLQAQVELAVRTASGEDLSWPALVRSADGALPLLLLDGFDELLQATGASQSDYLERVVLFQQREADQGRPVAVVVTSRTAVADRARPVDGMIAVRLEPFGEAHIEQWIQIWNASNGSYFAMRGLQPLSVESVLTHRELAGQPLLLLMLAFYDAAGNPLQEDISLGEAELYERLLTRFAEREVRKSSPSLTADQCARVVEQELLYLSVTALAMFNRGRQWVTEAELDADLAALLPAHARQDVSGLRATLTAAQLIVGRFFFIHQGQATRDATRLSSYEFLHATFGEYLVARLVARELTELAAAAELNAIRSRPAAVDDAFLYAVLSFMPLTMRNTVVSFLTRRLTQLSGQARTLLRNALLALFRVALEPRQTTMFDTYHPSSATVPGRHAIYSANLILLIVLIAHEVTGDDLFGDQTGHVASWRRIALLWRSQLPTEGWTELLRVVALHRGWDGDRQVIRLASFNSDRRVIPPPDLYWTYNFPEASHYRRGWFSWTRGDYDEMLKQSNFVCDVGDDAVMHALEPLPGRFAFAFSGAAAGPANSAANALIRLWLASNHSTDTDGLVTAYEKALEVVKICFAPADIESRQEFATLFLRQLIIDQQHLPDGWFHSILDHIDTAGERNLEKVADFLHLARQIVPELMEGFIEGPA